MAKILFFGTCAGTEPIEGMHHAAIAIEINGFYYWFDAGENCSRTATHMGVDLLKVKHIFISHTHMDHVAGLVMLLWNINKFARRKDISIDNKISISIPNMASWEGIKLLLSNDNKNFFDRVNVDVNRTIDGFIYADENIKVSAVHNAHMGYTENDVPLSFSYIIDVADKRIVYTGDIKFLSELETMINNGCDILICETGHHKVADICRLVSNKNVKTLLFTHNGREIIGQRAEVEKILADCGFEARICYDGMVFEV